MSIFRLYLSLSIKMNQIAIFIFMIIRAQQLSNQVLLTFSIKSIAVIWNACCLIRFIEKMYK